MYVYVLCVYIHIYTYIYIYVHICVYIYICIHTCVYTRIHVHPHTSKYIHSHVKSIRLCPDGWFSLEIWCCWKQMLLTLSSTIMNYPSARNITSIERATLRERDKLFERLWKTWVLETSSPVEHWRLKDFPDDLTGNTLLWFFEFLTTSSDSWRLNGLARTIIFHTHAQPVAWQLHSRSDRHLAK